MFLIGNVLEGIAVALNMALYLYMWIIIIRALITWVNPDPYNPIVQFLYSVTDPMLYQIRKALPISGAGIDFSPIIAILIIYFMQYALVESLRDIAMHLQ